MTDENPYGGKIHSEDELNKKLDDTKTGDKEQDDALDKLKFKEYVVNEDYSKETEYNTLWDLWHGKDHFTTGMTGNDKAEMVMLSGMTFDDPYSLTLLDREDLPEDMQQFLQQNPASLIKSRPFDAESYATEVISDQQTFDDFYQVMSERGAISEILMAADVSANQAVQGTPDEGVDMDGMNIPPLVVNEETKRKIIQSRGGIGAMKEFLAFNAEWSQYADEFGNESKATEHAWQCDVCGKHLVDGKAANQHQQETGHYDMGFTATLSGDTKFDKLGEGQGGTYGRSDFMLNPQHEDITTCVVCGRDIDSHSNPNTDYRGMRGDAPPTDHYFLGGDQGGSDDKYDFESYSKEESKLDRHTKELRKGGWKPYKSSDKDKQWWEDIGSKIDIKEGGPGSGPTGKGFALEPEQIARSGDPHYDPYKATPKQDRLQLDPELSRMTEEAPDDIDPVFKKADSEDEINAQLNRDKYKADPDNEDRDAYEGGQGSGPTGNPPEPWGDSPEDKDNWGGRYSKKDDDEWRERQGYEGIINILNEADFQEDEHPRADDGKFSSGGGSSGGGKHADKSEKDLVKAIKGGSKEWKDWGRNEKTEELYAEIEKRNKDVPIPSSKYPKVFRDDPEAVSKMEQKIKVIEDQQAYWKKIIKFPSRDYKNHNQLGDAKWYEMSLTSTKLREAKKKLEGIKAQQERGTTLTRKPTYQGGRKNFYYSEEPKGESRAKEFKPELQGKKIRITGGDHAGEIAVVTSVEIFGDSVQVDLEGNRYYNIPEGQYEVLGESRAKEAFTAYDDYFENVDSDGWSWDCKICGKSMVRGGGYSLEHLEVNHNVDVSQFESHESVAKEGTGMPDEVFYTTYDTEDEVRALGATSPVIDEDSGKWYWNNYVWRVQHGDDVTNLDGFGESHAKEDSSYYEKKYPVVTPVEDIVQFVLQNPEGVSNQEIQKHFYPYDATKPDYAETEIERALNGDSRVRQDFSYENKGWIPAGESYATESSVNCTKCQTRIWDKDVGYMNGTKEVKNDNGTVSVICGNCKNEVVSDGMGNIISGEARAKEVLVSWDVDGSTTQTNADSQFAALIPIFNGVMKASFRSTEDGSFSFAADFEKERDAKEWADNLRDMPDVGVKNISVESYSKEADTTKNCPLCGKSVDMGNDDEFFDKGDWKEKGTVAMPYKMEDHFETDHTPEDFGLEKASTYDGWTGNMSYDLYKKYFGESYAKEVIPSAKDYWEEEGWKEAEWQWGLKGYSTNWNELTKEQQDNVTKKFHEMAEEDPSIFEAVQPKEDKYNLTDEADLGHGGVAIGQEDFGEASQKCETCGKVFDVADNEAIISHVREHKEKLGYDYEAGFVRAEEGEGDFSSNIGVGDYEPPNKSHQSQGVRDAINMILEDNMSISHEELESKLSRLDYSSSEIKEGMSSYFGGESYATESSVNCTKCQTRIWDKDVGYMNGTKEVKNDNGTVSVICGNCKNEVVSDGMGNIISGESKANEGVEDHLDIGIDRWTGEPIEHDWKEDIDLMSKQELIDHIDISLPDAEYDYAVALLDSKFGGESRAKETEDWKPHRDVGYGRNKPVKLEDEESVDDPEDIDILDRLLENEEEEQEKGHDEEEDIALIAQLLDPEADESYAKERGTDYTRAIDVWGTLGQQQSQDIIEWAGIETGTLKPEWSDDLIQKYDLNRLFDNGRLDDNEKSYYADRDYREKIVDMSRKGIYELEGSLKNAVIQRLGQLGESKKKAIEDNLWQSQGKQLNCPVCGLDFNSGRDMGDHLIVEHAWEDSDFEQFEEGRVNEAETKVSPNSLLRDTDPLALPTGKNALDQTYGTSEPETEDGQDLTGKTIRRKSTYESIIKMLTENVFDYNEDEIFDNIVGGYSLRDEKDAVFDSYYKDIEDQKNREEAERRARDKEEEDRKNKAEDDYRRERSGSGGGNVQYDWGRHNRELHQYGYGRGY